MACSSCGTDGGKSKGCRSNGGCDTGGCNKLNTYDWLSTMQLDDPNEVNLVEVSFRNGAHKSFFRLQHHLQAETGDDVVVEADGGYDVGRISLRGALVPIQMRKKSVDINSAVRSVLRIASQNDLDRLAQARSMNKSAIVRSRAIAAMLGIEMKIGDVEYRADLKKATFYYTADGRVDFRELIRHYAKEFRVKIEMRQIGSRQESSRIGGLGSCGRELCCSTWLTDYKSVTTNAARYQNLAINQAKLSGQCGRLKCCLNYELDVYMEAMEEFPTNADTLQYTGGFARLIKTDIFKKLMFYIKKDQKGREAFITLTVDEVISIQNAIANGHIPENIVSTKIELYEEIDLMKSEDLTGHIELPDEKRRKKKKNRNKGQKNEGNKPNEGRRSAPSHLTSADDKTGPDKAKDGAVQKQEGRRNDRKDRRREHPSNERSREAQQGPRPERPQKSRQDKEIRQDVGPATDNTPNASAQDPDRRNKNKKRHHPRRSNPGQNNNTQPPQN